MSDFNLSDMYRMHLAHSIEQQDVEVVDLESWFEDDIKCGAANDHPKGVEGHRADEPGAYLVRLGCGHSRILCASRVAYPADIVVCGQCGHEQAKRDLTIVPI